MQCGVGTKGNGNGILPAQKVWFSRQGCIFVEAYVLSVRAARHSGRAEDLVSWLEPRNVFADSHDLSSQLCSEDAFFPRLPNAEHEFGNRQHGFGNEREIAHVAIPGRHRGRMYLYENFFVPWCWPGHLFNSEKVRGPVSGVQNGFHNWLLAVTVRVPRRARRTTRLPRSLSSSG